MGIGVAVVARLRRRGRRVTVSVRRLVPAALVVVCAAVSVALGVAAWLGPLPETGALVRRASPDATKIYDRDGRLLFEVLDPLAGRRTRVSLGDLSTHLVDAVIATEDAGFYSHAGVEPRAILRAALGAVRHGHASSGASTITQQLARLVLMDDAERQERSARRKLREMIVAVRLTRRYDKDEILERYLNEVYFGQLAYGAEAAARTYFGKPAAQLDLAEAAMLAGLIQSPSAYNPLVDLGAARERQAVVLDLMVGRGLIGRDAARQAAAERLRFTAGGGPMEAPHFVAWVLAELESRYGAHTVQRGGLHVVTSLDLDLQRQAEAVARRHVADLRRREPGKPDYHVTNAALTAVDPRTGQVLAMVGSVSYFDAEIDGAVNVALAPRQPGSAIKPLTYLTAFDTDRWGVRRPSGSESIDAPTLPFTPATVLSDVPTSFTTREGEPYRPMNYDRKWHGPIPLRRALATSSNMVAVKVLDAVGVDALVDTCQALGLRTLDERERYGLALTLGGGEVRLLELTSAYAGLAAGGRRVTPLSILAVLDAEGLRTGLEGAREWKAASAVSASPVVSERAAFLVTDILSDDAARIPAFGEAGVLALDRPAAVKTGTTTDFRDNWTVGYSPDLAVGVWVGNADGSAMRCISGITGAAPIWRDTMAIAHRGRPVRTFLRPEGLERVEVCTAGGGLPDANCRRRAREWFAAGTQPRHLDRSYITMAVDSATGRAWDEGCPGSRVERVFRVLPADARDWGRSAGVASAPERTCTGSPRLAEALPTAGAAPAGPDAIGLDRRPDGSRVEAGPGAPGVRKGAAALPPLEIVLPAANSTFALTARLPRESQRIDMAALSRGGPLREVALLVDDVRVAAWSCPPYRTTWPLEPGAHRARAVGIDGSGRTVESPPIDFRVLAREPREAE